MSNRPQPNYRWIKYPISYLDDPDFMQLSDGAKGTFLTLYLLAGRSDAEGLLCSESKVFTLKDLTWILHTQLDILSVAVDELLQAGFMRRDEKGGYWIIRFLEEQGPADDKDRLKWRERQAAHRAKAKGEVSADQESESDKESDKEIKRGEGESEGHETIPDTIAHSHSDYPHYNSDKPQSHDYNRELPPPPIKKEHPAILLWREIVNPQFLDRDSDEIIAGLGENPDREALEMARDQWQKFALPNGKAPMLPKPILERYFIATRRNGANLPDSPDPEFPPNGTVKFVGDDNRLQHLLDGSLQLGKLDIMLFRTFEDGIWRSSTEPEIRIFLQTTSVRESILSRG